MNNQSGNVILGTLLGAALGFAAGVLLAPASGRETRDLLGHKAQDAKGALNDVTAKAMASLKEVKEAAERNFKGNSRAAASEAQSMRNEATNKLKNA